MDIDIIIVGQGLAGSLLAYFLQKEGLKVLIIDNQHQRCASLVAAGLMDAISGMRLTLAWNVNKLLPFAVSTYQSLEALTQTAFFHTYKSYRLFATESEVSIFQKKQFQPMFSPYYGPTFNTSPSPQWQCPYGGVETLSSYTLNTVNFLSAMNTHLKTNICYDSCAPSDLSFSETGVQFKSISAKKIIFCIGDDLRMLPWFSHLPFRPAKGETLTLNSEYFDSDKIFNFGKWAVPFGAKHMKYGATYEWDDLSWNTTEKGKTELTTYFKHFYTHPYSITHHQAGIRCMVKDLRPIVGFHPNIPALGVFGGLSSKGVMSAPYYANQLVQHLQTNKPLDTDVSLSRFF